MSFCRQMVIQKKLPFKILIANVTTTLRLCHFLNIFKINLSNYFFNDQFTYARKYILYQICYERQAIIKQASLSKISWNVLIEQLTQPFCKFTLAKTEIIYPKNVRADFRPKNWRISLFSTKIVCNTNCSTM